MIPRLAALSIAEIKVRIWSAFEDSFERAVFCMVRKRASALRLRSVRFNAWRDRLAADFVLAMGKSNVRRCSSQTLHSLAQSEFWLVPLGRKRSTHSHFVDAQSTGTLSRAAVIAIVRCVHRLWRVLG